MRANEQKGNQKLKNTEPTEPLLKPLKQRTPEVPQSDKSDYIDPNYASNK